MAEHNIADHNMAELNFAEHESQSLLFYANPLPMWIYDMETLRFLEVNDAAVVAYGYSRKEFLEMTISDIHPREEQASLQELKRTAPPQWVDTGVWQHRLQDGSLIFARILSSDYTYGGKTARLVTAQDITAQKRTEDQLTSLYRLSRELAILNDRAAVMQYVVDQTCRLLGAPWGAFVSLTDFSAEEPIATAGYEYALSGLDVEVGTILSRFSSQGAIGAHVFGEQQSLCVEDISALELFNQSALLEIAASSRLEMRGFLAVPVTSDTGRSLGGLFFCSPQLAHFQPHHQELAETIAAHTGVTLEKLLLQQEINQYAATLETRVAERTAEMERANAELEAFTYSVSHDLRAPLRAIDGFSQVILQKYSDVVDESGRHYLNRIRVGTQRMGKLIDDLLELSRINRQELRRKRVNLTRLANTIAVELAQLEPQRTVRLEIADGLVAQGDEHLLSIVIRNLFDNAWKFTGKTAEPVIRFYGEEQADNRWVYTVSDNGVGFDMAYYQKLFGVFQRLHQATEFPGTGVGLATVQRIIHRHRGEIWAHGEIQKGASFSFTLEPLPDPESVQPIA